MKFPDWTNSEADLRTYTLRHSYLGKFDTPKHIKLCTKDGYETTIQAPEPFSPVIWRPELPKIQHILAEATGVPVMSNDSKKFVRVGWNVFLEAD